MVFINATESIGLILIAGSTNLTGNIVATLLLILAVLFAIAMMFQIPLEFTAVIFLPLCLAMGSYYSNMLGPLIVILIFLSTLVAKNWLFK